MRQARILRCGGFDRYDFLGSSKVESMVKRISTYYVKEFGKPDERVQLYDNGELPSGLFQRVKDALESNGVKVSHEYSQAVSSNKSNDPLSNVSDIELRDYQREASDVACSSTCGTIRMATGSGKTWVACDIIERLSMKTYFIVHTRDLLVQTFESLCEWFGKGVVGMRGGSFDIEGRIIVTTIQSASNFVYDHNDDIHKAGCVIVDECHRVAAPVASFVMKMLPAKRRYGLSASPWRDDGADLAIEGAVGPVIVDMNASFLAEEGWLAVPIIRMLFAPAPVYLGSNAYNKMYDAHVVKNEERNDMIVSESLDMFRRGLSLMVIVRKIAHGHAIRDKIWNEAGFSPPFINGKHSIDFRSEVLEKMRKRKIRLMIASSIADEGLDVPALDGVVLAGGGKSSTKALQRIGRALRRSGDDGKEYAEIVDFMDEGRIFQSHSLARMSMYETEPGWIVTDV